jgi:hypothetical protein
MITQRFCDNLEYYIGDILFQFDELDIRRSWCDGVRLPENVLPVNGVIITKAWIDEGKIKGGDKGQFLYDLTLHLGKQALDQCNTGELNENSLPEIIDETNFYFNPEKREMAIWLL